MIDVEIEHESPDYINESEFKKTEFVKNDPPPTIPRKTKAQIWEDTVIQFKKFIYKKKKIILD